MQEPAHRAIVATLHDPSATVCLILAYSRLRAPVPAQTTCSSSRKHASGTACALGRCSPSLQRLVQTTRLRPPLLQAPALMLARRSRRRRARPAMRLLAGHAPAAEGRQAHGCMRGGWTSGRACGIRGRHACTDGQWHSGCSCRSCTWWPCTCPLGKAVELRRCIRLAVGLKHVLCMWCALT
jgi:hypothetical protein